MINPVASIADMYFVEAKFVLPKGDAELSNFLLQTFISRESLQ